jgi:hypothetical protein
MHHRKVAFAVACLSIGCDLGSGLEIPIDLAHEQDFAIPPDFAMPRDMAQPLPPVDAFTVDGFTLPSTLGEGMPQVIRQDPGGVIASPKVVVATWANDPYRSDIEAFYTAYAASPQWAAQTSEYGVGALTVLPPIHLSGNAPAVYEDTDIQALLASNLGPSAPWGPPDSSTVYTFVIPETVSFDQANGGCCGYYGGYHADAMVGGVDVSYAILCECPDGTLSGTTKDGLTDTASHEMIEAVTDAFPINGAQGYTAPGPAFAGWIYASSGEIADLCEFADTAFWKPPMLGYEVQRTWSNAAAAAGHDPCVSDGMTPYYQTIPATDATIPFSGGEPFSSTVTGFAIPIGKTAWVPMRAFADGSTGPLVVELIDYSGMFGSSTLAFSPQTITVQPGDTFHIAITALDVDWSVGGNLEVFQINTRRADNIGPTTYFYGTIIQP